MYKLIISPRVQNELKKIKLSYKTAISLALQEIKDDPSLGKPLTRDLTGKFSYRVGVYRIIYKTNIKDQIIYILSTGHRATIYQSK